MKTKIQTPKNLNLYLIIGGALLIAILSFFAGRATIKPIPHSEGISQADFETKMNQLTNNLNSKWLIQLADSADKIQKLYKQKNIAVGKQLKSEIEIANYKDSLARLLNNKTCNEALDAKQKVIMTMGLKAYNDSIQLYQCNYQKTLKDDLIKEKESAFLKQVQTTKDLQKKLDDIPGERKFIPHVDFSYNSFGFVGIGAGIYYHDISLGGKLLTNFKEKGFEINSSIKF